MRFAEYFTEFIATITVGDEYHKVGEEHTLSSWEIESTKEQGLKLKVKTNSWGDTFYHLYPCSIRKVTYKLEPVEIATVEGGDRKNVDYKPGDIGFDKTERDYDWKDHWC